MKWWYENEEDMPRKITLVDYDKEGNPFHRDVVIPETAEEARRLEECMEFDKSRVFSSVNADELRAGDKVIVADDLDTLKRCVKENDGVDTLYKVEDETDQYRFRVIAGSCEVAYNLAYLVERAENCTNCGSTCGYADANHHALQCSRCDNWQPKTEPTAKGADIPKNEKKYRPFTSVDELIGVWQEKCPSHNNREKSLTMPLIWVRGKKHISEKVLITGFDCENVWMGECWISLETLLVSWEFLDGSTCGVEE